MDLEQISVFMENRPGSLADITRTLAQADVNIRALSLADTADFGILRLVVNQPDKARRALQDGGFTVGTTKVLALEIPDRPGGLGNVLQILATAAINVEYMYAFVQKSGENAVVIFRFDEPDRAAHALQGAGVRVLAGEDVYAM
jgi:hypothetical protein